MKSIKHIITGKVLFTYDNVIRPSDVIDVDLTYTNFSDAVFSGDIFVNFIAPNSNFDGSIFNGSIFNDATFEVSSFKESVFNRSKFNGSTFNYSTFNDSTFNDSIFDDSKFYKVTFQYSQLKYIIPFLKTKIPVITDIHQKIYAACSVEINFDMSAWHSSCGTTHCEAGHLTLLAGELGKQLENEVGTALAAMMIYHKNSNLPIERAYFFQSHKNALKRMKKYAEIEGERK